MEIGLSLMDRFTSAMLDFFQAQMANVDKSAATVRGFSGGVTTPVLRDSVSLKHIYVYTVPDIHRRRILQRRVEYQ